MLFFKRAFIISLLITIAVAFSATYFASAASVNINAAIPGGSPPPPPPPPPVDVLGCTDPSANNYNAFATIDNGTCAYDVWGCTDPAAINYDPSATIDDGSCIAVVLGCTDLAANNYDQLANQDDGSCKYTGKGCTDPAAINYNPKAKKDDGTCIYSLEGCMDVNAINYSINATIDDGSCIYQIFGCTNLSATNYNPNATDDDGSCIISGCMDPSAVNYNPLATADDGTCVYYGCTNPLADNYDASATIDDGSCVVSGCTNSLADNYDPTATVDNGSCIIFGCTDPTAINYNSMATSDNGTCSYDPEDIPGCMDTSAQNYNPTATVDDGTCTYPISGCTDPLALNYNGSAVIDNGSCAYEIVEPPEPSEVPELTFFESIFGGGGFEPEFYYYTDSNRLRLEYGGFGDNDLDLLIGRELLLVISDKFPKEVESITAFIRGQELIFTHDANSNRYLLQLGTFNNVGKNNLKLAIEYRDGSNYEQNTIIEIQPLGHIFSKLPEDETRIFGISIFLYDENDQVVIGLKKISKDGTYGFMVANGRYKLVVYDNGEKIYDGRLFTVRDNIVNTNIGLSLWEQIVEAATETAKLVNDEILNNPVVEEVNAYVAPTVVTIVSITTMAAIPWWSLVNYLQYFFTEPLAWLFRRRKKGWGVVYDSITKQPVDLAVVRLYDIKTDKLIKSKVTDKQGRYNFLVSEGEYYIKVVKSTMIFPSVVLKDFEEDKQFVNLYHGETINISKDQKGIISANIPVDSQEAKISDKEILRKKFWHKVKKDISIAGPLFSMVSFTISPGLLIGSFTVGHLIFFLLFKRLADRKEPSKWGVILDAKTHKPLSGAIVKIYSPEYNKMLETQVADRHGRYGFLAGNNVYYITADKVGYQTNKTDIFDLTHKKSDEVVGRDIELSPLDTASKDKVKTKDETIPDEVALKESSSLEEMAEKIKESAQQDKKEEPQVQPEKIISKEKSDLAELAEKIKDTAKKIEGDVVVPESVEVDGSKDSKKEEVTRSADNLKEDKFG